MGEFMKFVQGDIAVIPFPFSDLSGSKRRPALVIADLGDKDVILCQITSVVHTDPYTVPLDETDFETGTLARKSFIRVNKIFTASRRLLEPPICRLKPEPIRRVIDVLIGIVQR